MFLLGLDCYLHFELKLLVLVFSLALVIPDVGAVK